MMSLSLRTLVRISILAATALSVAASAARAAGPTIVVPTDYPTIQQAIDAAPAGGTVQIRPGTYFEQLMIDKDLTLVGAGAPATVIRAPAAMVNGLLGFPAIVEIFNGARVAMSLLTVAGPSAIACGALDASGSPLPKLRWGIRVHSLAHLDFSYGAVRDIHDSPMAVCPASGVAIAVGQPQEGTPPASANIHHSEIANYQAIGLIGFGAGSVVNAAYNTVAGPGHAGGVPTDGIELVVGAVGTLQYNTVSGNICPPTMPEDCGPDFFTQFQHAGIVAGGNGPGTVVSNNRAIGNQVGMFVLDVDALTQNTMIDNDYFGLGLVTLTPAPIIVDGARIIGGGGGIWITPVASDMTVVLRNVTFAHLSGPEVEILQGTGFTATVTSDR